MEMKTQWLTTIAARFYWYGTINNIPSFSTVELDNIREHIWKLND